MSESLGEKAARATKWSVFTQIVSKLVSPVTQMVLARILAPEAFGVVALVNMVVSLADMFSDAGFQKYLVQHEFDSDEGLRLSADVAFWTNMGVSLTLWLGIALARDGIASLVGSPSVGPAIAVACSSLPLTAAVSVQTSIYQRVFDFRSLFRSRVGSSLLIFVVSVPLAALGCSYWSLIVGTIASNAFLAIWLTARSMWKPRLRYDIGCLHDMFSFSMWTLVEAFSIWLTGWVGTLILGTMLDARTVGLFNTPTSFANAATGIATSVVNPVAFSALSRLQGNHERFAGAVYGLQRMLAYAVVPMGIAILVFRDVLVRIVLGDAWLETSTLFGLQGIACAVVIVFGHVASEAYRAYGKPLVSFVVQLWILAYTIPSYVLGARGGFATLSVVVPLARLLGVVAHFVACKVSLGLSPTRMLRNVAWIYAACALDGLACTWASMALGQGFGVQCALMVAFMVIYAVMSLLVPQLRLTLTEILSRFGILGRMPARVSRVLTR